MDRCLFAAGDAGPTAVEVRDNFVAPFLAAACSALGEMAGTEVVAQAVAPSQMAPPFGDIAVVVRLLSVAEHRMVLRFPLNTATALAGRMLAGATQDIDEALVHDCAGEIANVIAGQAKATLAGTQYHFNFALPVVMPGDSPELLPDEATEGWLSVLRCESGQFSLQLLLSR
jgi:CheY-specific phosphatase CheX